MGPPRDRLYLVGPPRDRLYLVGTPGDRLYLVGPPRDRLYLVGPPRNRLYLVGPPRDRLYLLGPPRGRLYLTSPHGDRLYLTSGLTSSHLFSPVWIVDEVLLPHLGQPHVGRGRHTHLVAGGDGVAQHLLQQPQAAVRTGPCTCK